MIEYYVKLPLPAGYQFIKRPHTVEKGDIFASAITMLESEPTVKWRESGGEGNEITKQHPLIYARKI